MGRQIKDGSVTRRIEAEVSALSEWHDASIKAWKAHRRPSYRSSELDVRPHSRLHPLFPDESVRHVGNERAQVDRGPRSSTTDHDLDKDVARRHQRGVDETDGAL